jgi:putative NADPH-quinone reductase
MSFKRLEADDFIISSDAITAPLWSTNLPALVEFYTSSVQEAGSSGNYYLSVYQTGSGLTGAEVQFDITYGNLYGVEVYYMIQQ